MKKPLVAQKGFAAIAAIFLVVVLAAMGAFMLTFSNTQQLTSAQDVQGTRAYWAARAGLEWGIGFVRAQPAGAAVCPASPTILAPAVIGGFTVVVTCNRLNYIEGGATVNIFQFTSLADNRPAVAGSLGFIERTLSASMDWSN
jgi:MSHA biogenesis protein MshP